MRRRRKGLMSALSISMVFHYRFFSFLCFLRDDGDAFKLVTPAFLILLLIILKHQEEVLFWYNRLFVEVGILNCFLNYFYQLTSFEGSPINSISSNS
jgi:hypothetical protein